MPLSCSCDYDDDYAWYAWPPNNYTTMQKRTRRARCSSCGSLIEHGATVAEFTRTRGPRCDYEVYRFGEDCEAITLASWYLCETCADLYFSLDELGYKCILPGENIRDLVREYAALRGEDTK